jgi:hypothetical protein
MDSDTLMRDYLGRLEAAASHLPEHRRVELVGDVREHIEFALAEAGSSDEATVRNVLERLGPPDEIVAAEAGASAPTPNDAMASTEPGERRSRAVSVETRALTLLTFGAVVLPFVGPLLGLWFVSASARWTLAQKRTATLVVLVLLAMPLVFLVPALVSGEITWVFSSGGFLLPFIPLSGIVAAMYLVGSTSVVLTVSRRHD